ncbi:MAG: DUF1028 domain-containing protein [Candidatus Eiseniibacteriota bacterium]
MSRTTRCALLACAAFACAAPARAVMRPSTFSIVAYDSVTHELGVAVQSKYFSVGSVVPWAEAGVGAVATQAQVNTSYGPQALAMLRSGIAPDEVLRGFAANDSSWAFRQLGIVDAHGRVASWTGPKCNDWAGGIVGPDFACQGNILAGSAVVAGMARAFRETQGELGERMIAALEMAQAAGGDKRGQQSAALLVVRPSVRHPEYAHRYVDLKVEDHRAPIAELRRLWHVHQGFHGAAAHMELAAEYGMAGRHDLAGRERERVRQIIVAALARGERDASMLNGLAWSCATHDFALEDAARAAERAAAIEPKSTDILDTLAEVYFRMNRIDRAIAIESRAAALDPKSQYLKDQLARFRGARTAGNR